MNQLNLFDNPPQPTEQQKQLVRVKSKIAVHIRAYLANHGEFHMNELVQFVQGLAPVAPASCDRILREMRRAGELDYEVVNRRASHYRLKWIA